VEGPDRKTPSPDAPPKAKHSWILWVSLALLALLLVSYLIPSGSKLPYSDLKEKIRADQVERVVIGQGEVRATPKDPAEKKKGTTWTSGRGDADELEKLLDEKKVAYEYEAGGGLLASLLPWVLLFGGMILFWGWILKRMKPGAGVMSVGKSKAKLVAENKTGVTFKNVAGVDEAVEELAEIVDFLAHPEKFRKLGGRIPKGVLLVGPPGTGKTLLARAVAGEAKVPFFQLTGSDFVEMFVGVGAARVRDLFATAQAKAPCIVFIDELDAIGKARGVGVMAGHDEREQTLNQLLSEMDGFDAKRGLIVMAATNRPEILDAALMRPGRFDRQVLVDRPDKKGRLAILQVHAKDVKLGPDVDLERIAALTPGFAGAELENTINEAALLAARRQKTEVTMSEMNEAIERVVAGLEKKNRRMNEREKNVVSHHESGHALLAEVLPTTDRVHKVSIIPRGLGALGYTMQLPLEDRYLMQRQELLDKICVLLGGRAAEVVIFGEISTGASDDLERATDLARRMCIQYGMSETLGPQAYSAGEQAKFLPTGMSAGSERLYSERTAEKIDAEVSELLHRCMERTIAIVRHNKKALERLAHILLNEEIMEGDRLRTILEGASIPAEALPPSVHAAASVH
jgi:cell division protease FtsH